MIWQIVGSLHKQDYYKQKLKTNYIKSLQKDLISLFPRRDF